MNRSMCLVDPSIADGAGHYAEYARAICRSAQDMGYTFRVLAHCTIRPDLARDLGAEPVFRYGFWHDFVHSPRKLRFVLNPVLTNWAFYQDLNRAIRGWVDTNWVLFMPTVDHRQMLAWAALLAQCPPARSPQATLLFRYTYFDGDQPRPWRDAYWARLGFWALERVASTGHRLRIVTDSTRLAQQYSQLTQFPVEVFPIPHTADLPVTSCSSSGWPRPLRLASLGDAREEKGFALLANVIQRLALYAPHRLDGLEFVLQCPITHASHEPMKAVRQALANLRLPNVRLVDHVLDRKSYAHLLAQADVVLLPYARRVFYARTSGPFTEALAAGKPVIVTADTWMSDQLANFGAGVTFNDGDIEDLTRALLEMQEHYQELARQAEGRRDAWVAFHNPERLIRCLLELS